MQRLQQHRVVLPLVTLIIVYVFLSLTSLVGVWAYIVPSICWIILSAITLKIYTFNKIRSAFNQTLTLLAVLTAAAQIVTLVFIAFFTSFGRSPYTSGNILLNMLYFLSGLVGTELARAQIVTAFPKRKKLLGIAVIAIFFAIITFSPARYLSLGEPVETTKFIGSNLLPTIAASLLATYLALLGGPAASLAYMGTLQGFQWLSPILPTPDWTIQALIGTLIPAVSFLAINEAVKPFTLFRHGLLTRKEITHRIRRNKKSFSLSWIAIAFIALILMWGNSGLLGFQPSIIASGSMQPNLNVGDITIVVHAEPEAIQVGDVIQYRTTDEPIIHRVINKYTEAGQTWFTTKGDANDIPDPEPVNEQQLIGKATITIPQVGWVSIAVKEAAAAAYTFLTTLPQATVEAGALITTCGIYIATPLALIALIYAVITNITHKREAK